MNKGKAIPSACEKCGTKKRRIYMTPVSLPNQYGHPVTLPWFLCGDCGYIEGGLCEKDQRQYRRRHPVRAILTWWNDRRNARLAEQNPYADEWELNDKGRWIRRRDGCPITTYVWDREWGEWRRPAEEQENKP